MSGRGDPLADLRSHRARGPEDPSDSWTNAVTHGLPTQFQKRPSIVYNPRPILNLGSLGPIPDFQPTPLAPLKKSDDADKQRALLRSWGQQRLGQSCQLFVSALWCAIPTLVVLAVLVMYLPEILHSGFALDKVPTADGKGPTLVHFLAHHKRFLWDRSAFRGCLGGVKGVLRRCSGILGDVKGVFCVETAQVELKSGRV